MIKEYYQKKGMDLKDSGTGKPSVPSGQAAARADLALAGRCGVVSLSWAEAKMIDKESIEVKRKTRDDDYLLLKDKKIYQREEATGEIRYWVGDDGLKDGNSYQYLVSFKNEHGIEEVRGPVSINLSCTEKDREMIAQREKLLKEYYQKQATQGTAIPGAGTSPYQRQLARVSSNANQSSSLERQQPFKFL